MISDKTIAFIDDIVYSLPQGDLVDIFEDFVDVFNALPDLDNDAIDLLDCIIQGIKERIEDEV